MFDNQTITLVISFKTGFFYLSYIGNYPRKILRTQTQKKTKARNFIKTKDSEGKKMLNNYTCTCRCHGQGTSGACRESKPLRSERCQQNQQNCAYGFWVRPWWWVARTAGLVHQGQVESQFHQSPVDQ